ncbi:Fc receptor-like A isoform X2 [Canis lupus baileyi]|uniref:Fc receptor like A n=2 Tax=Canis lupus familiaris TaxID=9615 RepID=A0A8C0SEN4_CANLF|nr:Fc receptor-like A isoform X2 [Canis lupus dingo]XP_038304099.1 Fc receptor-like A [Canis lupus familiaris]XP_038441853.1 Fc receptor-like A [Canis lupus familiaris]
MLKKISVLEAAGDLNTVTMRLGCVLTAGVLYFSPTVLWAAQMLLGVIIALGLWFPAPAAGCHAAAPFETLQCEGPVSTQDSSCDTQEDLMGPREVDFQVKGYTFSKPFHLIVSYDWLILQGPVSPIFEGDPLTLRCQAWQDWPLAQVTFYRDGSAMGPPGPNREFSIAVVQETDSGHYHCSGILRSPGPGSPETASSVAIKIQELFPAPLLRATPSAEPREGDPVTLSCQTKLPLQRSTTRLFFSFYKDSRTVRSRGLSPEFQIPTASKAHSGSYWCEAATEDNQVWKQSSKLEIRVQSPSSSTSSRTLNPAPQKSPVPESTPTAFPGPQPPLSTPSKNPGFSSPLQVPDPHLYHQMGILLKQMQDMRALLGHLVMELRDLSVRLKLETIKGPVEYE